jgi:hypothetical protein
MLLVCEPAYLRNAGEMLTDAWAGSAGPAPVRSDRHAQVARRGEAAAGHAGRAVVAGGRRLPVRIEHAATVERLPWVHRDPFDRLLAAQALTEDAMIVFRDEPLGQYGVSIVW